MFVKTDSNGKVIQQKPKGATFEDASKWQEFDEIPPKSVDQGFLYVNESTGELYWKGVETELEESKNVSALRKRYIKRVGENRRRFIDSDISVLGDDFVVSREEMNEAMQYYSFYLMSNAEVSMRGNATEKVFDSLPETFPSILGFSDFGGQNTFEIDWRVRDVGYRRIQESEFIDLVEAYSERSMLAKKRAKEIITELQNATTVSELKNVNLAINSNNV